jgi:hypothetical protein
MKTKRTTLMIAVVALAVMMIGGAAIAAGHLQPSTTDVQNTSWFADDSDAGGKSILTRTQTMVVATVEAANLEPGDVHTLWFVVFNEPEDCSDGVCGEDDIFGPDGNLNEAGIVAAQIGIGNASGNVAKSNGTAEFGAVLRQGLNNDHQVLFPAGFGGASVLTANPNDAEVHVIVQTHGQARGGSQLSMQLTYVDAACTPLCGDIQFAVHAP